MQKLSRRPGHFYMSASGGGVGGCEGEGSGYPVYIIFSVKSERWQGNGGKSTSWVKV